MFVCFLGFSGNIWAQTTVPSNASVSGSWTKSKSPYLIKGNIFVPKDSALTIEPGVEVHFDGKIENRKGDIKNQLHFINFKTLFLNTTDARSKTKQ